MNKARAYLKLFAVFFKIGLFTFGGGYAMISLIESELSEKRQWISAEELMDTFAISESTPGPISINCATYIGYKQAGIMGALSATLGVVVPSFIIIYVISLVIDQFMAMTVVANAFMGIQVAVAILILRAGFELMKKLSNRPLVRVVGIASFIAVFLINIFAWNFSTIWLILIGAIGGNCVINISRMRGEGIIK